MMPWRQPSLFHFAAERLAFTSLAFERAPDAAPARVALGSFLRSVAAFFAAGTPRLRVERTTGSAVAKTGKSGE